MKNQNQLFCTKNTKAEAKVEVFSSASILSLVNLMHPYCLKLHVEKEDKSREKLFLFSQEEVWKYERPTEESDEEINVVSDEEAPVEGTEEEDGLDAKGDKGRCLKSVLLNGNSSRAASTRERKRVSFGPVHVASFDEYEEEGVGKKNQLSGDTNETKSENLTPELPTLTPDRRDDADVGQQSDKKGEPKVKSLSLQEYRQLRRNRRPLVEKPGDYMTKWPSIPETPKELTPIFCFQGQESNLCRPKTTRLDPDLHKNESSSHCASSSHASNPSGSKRSSYPHRSRIKSSRAEPKMISPASPVPDDTANPNVILLERKKSPVKKQTLFNVDPPNPVLLSLPSNPAANSSSKSGCLQEMQNDLSAAPSQAIASDPESLVSSLNKEFNTKNTLFQESKASPTDMPPDVPSGSPVQTGSAPSSIRPPNTSPSQINRVEPLSEGSQSSSPLPVKSTKCPTPLLSLPPPIETSMLVKEELPDVLQIPSGKPPPPQTECKEQSAAVESGKLEIRKK